MADLELYLHTAFERDVTEDAVMYLQGMVEKILRS
jgi:hypothetical protein